MVTCLRPKDEVSQNSSMDGEGLPRPKLGKGKVIFFGRVVPDRMTMLQEMA